MITPWTSLLTYPLAAGGDTQTTTTLIPLPSLGTLSLTGPESGKFLQGQTSTDFREIEKGRVLPGAICSLKGRVLFSFIAIPDAENVLLVLPADQLEAALTHLKKYALFSRTQLTDTRPGIALAGVIGPDAEAIAQSLVGTAPAAGRMAKNDNGKWAVRMGADNRYLLGLPAETLAREWPALQQDATQKIRVGAESLWWAADIRDGFASIFAASRGLFQPQELNYQALEAVSYNKGCYTGQEVVARLYFRGKLKQRLYRLQADASPPAIGSGVFSGSVHVGDVVMAASIDTEKNELLAVVKNDAVLAGNLTLGENGPALRVLELPYELTADKEE